MKSAFKYKLVEKKAESLSEADCLAIFQSLVKQRKEAIEQYEAAGKSESAEKERKELEVISSYLPKALTDSELAELVQASIKKLGASTMKDMGAVMKDLGPQTLGRVDGKVLSDLVKKKLA